MDSVTEKKIQQFFTSSAYGVAGASNNRDKFGNKVLRAYLQHNKTAYPINPNEKTVEGVACVAKIADLPGDVNSISIITPPPITEKIMQQAIDKGIKHVWMQPGAESDAAISLGEKHGINVIAKGPCILIVLGFHG